MIQYLFIFCFFFFISPSHANAPSTKMALAVAQVWVKYLDQQSYDRSWAEAAEYFKKTVKKETWVKEVSSLRKSLGKVLSRQVLGSQHLKDIPKAPKGEYVVIRYKTRFQNQKEAIETVTPMLDPDGQWRVSGYFIH